MGNIFGDRAPVTPGVDAYSDLCFHDSLHFGAKNRAANPRAVLRFFGDVCSSVSRARSSALGGPDQLYFSLSRSFSDVSPMAAPLRSAALTA